MKQHTFGFLALLIGLLFVFGCSTSIANVPKSSTETPTKNTILLDDEFDSLNSAVWSAFPSLTPFAGHEGSKLPGEVKVEDGVLKLSRYAPELVGDNQASFIQTKNTIDLPDTFSTTMRFRNEFVAFGFGKVFVEIYNHKIAVGHGGLDGVMDNTYSYHGNNNNFFILALRITGQGYTIMIKEDTANSTEESFSQDIDLSGYLGASTIMIWGGSNTKSAPYSEVDYIRINK